MKYQIKHGDTVLATFDTEDAAYDEKDMLEQVTYGIDTLEVVEVEA